MRHKVSTLKRRSQVTDYNDGNSDYHDKLSGVGERHSHPMDSNSSKPLLDSDGVSSRGINSLSLRLSLIEAATHLLSQSYKRMN